MRTLHGLIALMLSCLAPVARSQAPLITGTTPSASTIRARYEAAMHAQVDSVVRAWQAAFAARNAGDLSELYANDAIVTLSGGGALVGRKAIRSGYERFIARLRSPRIKIEDVTRNDDGVHVRGTVVGQVTGPGGSYEHTGAIELLLRENSWARLEIATQQGGDLLFFSALSPPSADRSALAPDTIRVQLLNVVGDGVANAEVAFAVNGKRGGITPAFAATDAQGIATAVFTASSLHETDTVTARATLLPGEPVLFRFRVLAPEVVAAARELILAAGARAHFESALQRAIAERRRSMPDVPPETWDGINADSAVDAVVGRLAPLYAERLSMETMRAITDFYGSPAGREFVGAQSFVDAELPSAERQWSALLDQWIAAKRKPTGSAPPR